MDRLASAHATPWATTRAAARRGTRMTELLLVRHGEPEASVRADPGLSAAGFEQAKRLARWLAAESIDVVVSSPLRRAKDTADTVGDALGLPVAVVDDVREWERAGGESGYTVLEHMAADDPRSTALADGRYSDFVPIMDVAAFRARVELGFGSLFDRYPTGRVVVASHGGAINCFLANILGLSEIFFFLPDYGSVSRVERLASGRTVIRSVNETGHLEDRV